MEHTCVAAPRMMDENLPLHSTMQIQPPDPQYFHPLLVLLISDVTNLIFLYPGSWPQPNVRQQCRTASVY